MSLPTLGSGVSWTRYAAASGFDYKETSSRLNPSSRPRRHGRAPGAFAAARAGQHLPGQCRRVRPSRATGPGGLGEGGALPQSREPRSRGRASGCPGSLGGSCPPRPAPGGSRCPLPIVLRPLHVASPSEPLLRRPFLGSKPARHCRTIPRSSVRACAGTPTEKLGGHSRGEPRPGRAQRTPTGPAGAGRPSPHGPGEVRPVPGSVPGTASAVPRRVEQRLPRSPGRREAKPGLLQCGQL